MDRGHCRKSGASIEKWSGQFWLFLLGSGPELWCMHQSPVTHLEFLITEELAAIHSMKGTLWRNSFSIMKFNTIKLLLVSDDHVCCCISTSDIEPDFNWPVLRQNRVDFPHWTRNKPPKSCRWHNQLQTKWQLQFE